MMIKTCGTTIPLNAVGTIIAAARALELNPIELTYSRSSFVFPDLQLFPHNSLDVELKYLDEMDLGLVESSETGLMGDAASRYWLVHSKGFKRAIEIDDDRSVMVDCIMTGLSPEARLRYFKDMAKEDHRNEQDMSSSLQTIDESCRIVGKCYDPCGYSCNAHGTNERYFTVHITPEEAFSYASVETVFERNQIEKMEGFVRRVAKTFGPQSLVLTIMAPSEIAGDVTGIVSGLLLGDYIPQGMGSRSLCRGKMTAMSIMFTFPSDPVIPVTSA
jgi:S-adenosylmethionine decarboxylase